MEKYKVWDSISKQFVSKSFDTYRQAARSADKKNFDYGSTRYFARIEK